MDLNVHKVLATAATTAAAAATVSKELWTSGGAPFQRAQEPNIPCGESLTSTNRFQKGIEVRDFLFKYEFLYFPSIFNKFN